MGSIYIGLIFIAIGILIKVFPNLLAGYNQLSNREKENAISNGLPTFAFILLGVMGLIIIAGYFVGIWIDKPSIGQSIIVFVSLAGAVVMIVFGNILANKRIR
jgi:vacuolar-type H+-ATPase subunit I/STV1